MTTDVQRSFTAARETNPRPCRLPAGSGTSRLFYRYPSPDGRSARPIRTPSPFFIASLIFLALGGALAWLVFFLATQPVDIPERVATFEDVLPKIDRRCFEPGVDLYDCHARPIK